MEMTMRATPSLTDPSNLGERVALKINVLGLYIVILILIKRQEDPSWYLGYGEWEKYF